jgi:hypothetical protein
MSSFDIPLLDFNALIKPDNDSGSAREDSTDRIDTPEDNSFINETEYNTSGSLTDRVTPTKSRQQVKTTHKRSKTPPMTNTYVKRSWRTKSASFASVTPRFREKTVASPPSTQYNPNNVSANISSAESSFHSRTPRWYEPNEATKGVTDSQFLYPSPTTYSPEKVDLDKGKGVPSSASFRTTTPRTFVDTLAVKSDSPGPAVYRYEDVNLDSRQGTQSRASMSSTTRRLFCDQLAYKIQAPSPTHYSPEHYNPDSRKGNLSRASFTSTTARLFSDKPAHMTDSPAVTHYSPGDFDFDSRKGNLASVGFKSQTKRTFTEVDAHPTDSPAPTHYNPSDKLTNQFFAGIPYSASMNSTTRRLFLDKPAELPVGPSVSAYNPVSNGTFSQLHTSTRQQVQGSADRFKMSGMYTKESFPGPGTYYMPEIPESVDEAIMRRFNLQSRIAEVRQGLEQQSDIERAYTSSLINNVW